MSNVILNERLIELQRQVERKLLLWKVGELNKTAQSLSYELILDIEAAQPQTDKEQSQRGGES